MGDISNDIVYFHSSAMEDRLVSGVFSGCPFGGTVILVSSVFANRVSVVGAHNSRITAVRLCN